MNKLQIALAAIVLGLGVGLACAGTMKDISKDVQSGACETGCDEGKSACMDECTQKTEEEREGDARDTACELACEETHKQCMDDCEGM